MDCWFSSTLRPACGQLTYAPADVGGAGTSGQRRNAVDYVLVGGGLANSLIALFLAEQHPDVTFLILEKGPTLGGNHTWSFHTSDVGTQNMQRLADLKTASWPSQEVRFPRYTRPMSTGYHSISSERMHDVVMERFPDRVRLNTDVSRLTPTAVTLANGEEIATGAVIDGRGYRPSDKLELAFQKFIGVEYEFDAPHGSDTPVIMDATVAQRDGYRFIYTLPFTDRQMLVEDTYYADGPELDDDGISTLITSYVAEKNWTVKDIIRRERGILPIALSGDIDAFWAEVPDGITQTGLRAALFHPTTGYSLPDAVRLAKLVADEGALPAPQLFGLVRAHSIKTWKNRGMFRLLNRMLFNAADPDKRRDVLQRFYTLPQPLVERFYAGELTRADQLRILIGKPPVPITRAIGQLGPVRALRKSVAM
ncbi:MAG: lycopene beta-cyclase CrtY [Pseudomonadota bacterium]